MADQHRREDKGHGELRDESQPTTARIHHQRATAHDRFGVFLHERSSPAAPRASPAREHVVPEKTRRPQSRAINCPAKPRGIRRYQAFLKGIDRGMKNFSTVIALLLGAAVAVRAEP